MTDRQLMQQALDALELLARYENPATKVQVRKPRNGGPIVTMYPHKVATEAAAPLRERLAQPEQEPVATVTSESGNPNVLMSWWHEPALPVGTKIYTSPQRKPLTDEQINALVIDKDGLPNSHLEFARAIEAAHGIKGGV